jgi:hypothetical protein
MAGTPPDGHRPRTGLTVVGPVEIDVPRRPQRLVRARDRRQAQTPALRRGRAAGAPARRAPSTGCTVLPRSRTEGVGDALKVVCGGRTGLPDAISAVGPQASPNLQVTGSQVGRAAEADSPRCHTANTDDERPVDRRCHRNDVGLALAVSRLGGARPSARPGVLALPCGRHRCLARQRNRVHPRHPQPVEMRISVAGSAASLPRTPRRRSRRPRRSRRLRG